MYISQIQIQNYRCFIDSTVEFNDGLNILIGQNNAGKSNLLRALGIIFAVLIKEIYQLKILVH